MMDRLFYVVLAVACAVGGSACDPKQDVGMNLNFQQVPAFAHPALLITYGHNLHYMKVSTGSGFRGGADLYRGYIPGELPPAMAVRPDGTKFYIGTDDDLVEFDSKAALVRRIPIADFQLPVQLLDKRWKNA